MLVSRVSPVGPQQALRRFLLIRKTKKRTFGREYSRFREIREIQGGIIITECPDFPKHNDSGRLGDLGVQKFPKSTEHESCQWNPG